MLFPDGGGIVAFAEGAGAVSSGIDLLALASSIAPWAGAVLAGIGLWNILSNIFGWGSHTTTVQPVATPAYFNPLATMINTIMSMQIMSTLMSNLTNMFKPSGGGIDLSGILTAIVPVIGLVIALKLLGKI